VASCPCGSTSASCVFDCPVRSGPAQLVASQHRRGTSQQNELLFQHGINFNEIPAWQRRGTGRYWQSSENPGLDPRTAQATTAIRRSLHVEDQLPVKDDYRALIAAAIIGAGQV
jgi:tRNA(His) guanylyltransferase